MDLIGSEDIEEIRQAMTDIADTFAFPIQLIKTDYEEGAFASSPDIGQATGTIEYGDPVDGDTITIDGTEFTKAATTSSTEFSTLLELVELIEALDNVQAEYEDSTITVIATEPGTAGNDITLESSTDQLEVSGPTLSGGTGDKIFDLKAIRNFGSANETDRYRNALGPAGAGEKDLYVGWKSLEDYDLIDENNKILIDHNDLVKMEGEIYKILAYAGVADLTKKPTFMQMRVKRRFENERGATEV